MAWPALRLLEEKYPPRSRNAWRKQHDGKLNNMVRWRKDINSHRSRQTNWMRSRKNSPSGTRILERARATALL